jgi:hypothetical protein
MKRLQLVGLSLCLAGFVGCETTQTADMGNQERKRLAAIEQERAEAAQIDESTANLWNAESDRMNRYNSPAFNPIHP